MFTLLFILNIVVAVISYAVFSSVHVSPAEHWLAGFVSYLVPFALILNLFFVIFWLVFGKWKAIVSALVLVSGAGFVRSSVAIGNGKQDSAKEQGDLDVLSYNVRVFNAYASWKNKKEHSGERIAEWFNKEVHPDVVCFQEFYQNRREKYLDVISKMKSSGYPYYYFYKVLTDKGGGQFGMATFSKYPIKNHGDIIFKNGSNNMAIYIDISPGGETVRIFNIHLESMNIDDKNKDIEEVDKVSLYRKLKSGFKNRAGQVEKVLKAAKSSPFKVIICGDWNDLPYGYSYKIMQKYYNNAFEEAGSGFGFTFNGNNMSFLRIDNQFFNKTISIKKFDTFSDVKLSDHYPIMGRYNLD